MSLVLQIKIGEGVRIGENIFVQVKPSKRGARNYVALLIDAPKEIGIQRLTNSGRLPKIEAGNDEKEI